MPRWDIGDSARIRESDPPTPRDDRRGESAEADHSVGRGPSDNSSPASPEKPEGRGNGAVPREPSRRTEHRDRDRTYSLRRSEIEAMSDIGRFRTIDVQDLSRFADRGDEAHMT